jgi:hypothetical protein
MAKRSLSELLDRTVAALLAGESVPPLDDPRLVPLVRGHQRQREADEASVGGPGPALPARPKLGG